MRRAHSWVMGRSLFFIASSTAETLGSTTANSATMT
jgi:hypothetical protein